MGRLGTDVNFNEDVVASVVAGDVHYFEDTVTEAGGHVDYLLKLGVRGGCSGEILDMTVRTIHLQLLHRHWGGRFDPFENDVN